MENIKFEDLNLSPKLLKAIKEKGYEEATNIQTKAIPEVLKGSDVIGTSQTGTGKTIAFAIPMIEMIDLDLKKPQALILCPTRELALQITNEINELNKYMDIKEVAIYGGTSIDKQIKAIKKGTQIIVGTPGRTLDHLRRKTLKADNIKMLILDEADEMFNMGFEEDIVSVLEYFKEKPQIILFSATFPSRILNLTKKYQTSPVRIKSDHKDMTTPNIEQSYFEVKHNKKIDLLTTLLDIHEPKLAVIFCNTKRMVDELTETLNQMSYSSDGIHGDLRQNQRDMVMKKFRNGDINILIATDVAARGIDVNDVELVINFDIPQDDEYYVHRIGRTGRIGKKGIAYTFIKGREINRLKEIERYAKIKIKRGELPSSKDIKEAKYIGFTNSILDIISNNKVSASANEMVTRLVDDENNDLTSIDIAKALYTMYIKETNYKDFSTTDGKRKKSSVRDLSTLFFNLGKKDNIKVTDFIGSICTNCDVDNDILGTIDIHDKYTFIEVPKDKQDEILDIMNGNKINGKKVFVEKSNKR